LTGSIAPYRIQKLYHTAADFTLPGRQPITLPPITTTIEIGNYLETKLEAFRAHTSQQPLWAMFEEHTRKRGGRELFHLVAAEKAGPVAQESDLFAGVT
jgi:LmbE family N-acetylglucosaminyl deacetylase